MKQEELKKGGKRKTVINRQKNEEELNGERGETDILKQDIK